MSIETELKIYIGQADEARLLKLLATKDLRDGTVRTAKLTSIYCDTSGHDLAEAGISLRLRKVRRRWVQTVKLRPSDTGRGLFEAFEADLPAPGGRLNLQQKDANGLFGHLAEHLNGQAVAPVFETHVRRTTALLRVPGGTVEVALDRGEVVAGALSAPIREAEIELKEGEIGAVFEAARRLFPEGPIRFSQEAKADRGLRLALTGRADLPTRPRKAGDIDFADGATVEQAARVVFQDCFAQIADNMVVTIDSDDVEGPHQLRIGLRRLRTAFSTFRSVLGEDVFDALGMEARRIGRIVGELRDLDVLLVEIVAGASERGLEASVADELRAVLEERRQAVRETVRVELASPAATLFLFDLAEMIAGRRWLNSGDYTQSERLAAPVRPFADTMIERRHRKVLKRGSRPDRLEVEELHELRKDMKKLRYTIEIFEPLYAGKDKERLLKAAKSLQEVFGSINDAAMAGELLGPKTGSDARGGATWAAGWTTGMLAVEAEIAKADLLRRWKKFTTRPRFWS